MQPMAIRVMRPASPKQKLESAALYLGEHGTATVSEEGDVLALAYNRLGPGMPDIRYPIEDTGSLTITFDQRRGQWECASNLFGVPIKMADPKLFTYNVLSMTEDRIGSKIQFISKVQEYWQRYAGDGQQFASRLARDMGNTGVMTEVTDGGPVFAHFHNTFDTSFDVWFSASAGLGINPVYRFGFYPEVAMQPFELSVAGTADVIRRLQEQQAAVEAFLKPLIGCF